VVIVAELTAEFGWATARDPGAAAHKALVMWVEHGVLYLDADAYARLRVMPPNEIDQLLRREHALGVTGWGYDERRLPSAERLRWLAGLDDTAGPAPGPKAGGITGLRYASQLGEFARDVRAALGRTDAGLGWRSGVGEPVLRRKGYGYQRMFNPQWHYRPQPAWPGGLTRRAIANGLALAGLTPDRMVHQRVTATGTGWGGATKPPPARSAGTTAKGGGPTRPGGGSWPGTRCRARGSSTAPWPRSRPAGTRAATMP